MSQDIDLRRRQIRIYNQLARRPDNGAAELRRELIRPSCLISAHPYWAGRGWSMAGRVELVRAARSGPDGVREAVVRWNGEEFVVTEPEAQPERAGDPPAAGLSTGPGRGGGQS